MIHFDSSRIFARATYYVQQAVRRAPADGEPEDRPSSTRRATPKPIAGRVGVGTWNTAAEFTRHPRRARRPRRLSVGFRGGGRRLGARARAAARAAAARGRCRRARTGRAATSSRSRCSTASNAGPTSRSRCGRARSPARKGFLVFGGTVDGRRVQWNVARLGQHASRRFRPATRSSAAPVRGGIETGRWYDLRLEVRGRTVRGYLDGTAPERSDVSAHRHGARDRRSRRAHGRGHHQGRQHRRTSRRR